MRVGAGMSADETAQALGTSPGAVRVAQHRALTKLRQLRRRATMDWRSSCCDGLLLAVSRRDPDRNPSTSRRSRPTTRSSSRCGTRRCSTTPTPSRWTPRLRSTPVRSDGPVRCRRACHPGDADANWPTCCRPGVVRSTRFRCRRRSSRALASRRAAVGAAAAPGDPSDDRGRRGHRRSAGRLGRHRRPLRDSGHRAVAGHRAALGRPRRFGAGRYRAQQRHQSPPNAPWTRDTPRSPPPLGTLTTVITRVADGRERTWSPTCRDVKAELDNRPGR